MNRKLIRPSLTDVRDNYSVRTPPQAQAPAQGIPRKKPAPPEQTHAEQFYYVKQMQARTPVAVELTDGKILYGTIEWYDRDCIKLTRYGSPNLLLYKHSIRLIYKTSEEAAMGGSNGQ